MKIRRALISPRLPELRSGNAELDRWVSDHLQRYITEVFEQIKLIAGEIGEFTPTWTGFGTDPTGNVLYLDYGDSVELWIDTALTGTSDEAFMGLSGVPSQLWPSELRYCRCALLDESNVCGGIAVVGTSGAITFSLEQVVTSPPDGIGFADVFTDPSSMGYKGLPAGWLIQYTK